MEKQIFEKVLNEVEDLNSDRNCQMQSVGFGKKSRQFGVNKGGDLEKDYIFDDITDTYTSKSSNKFGAHTSFSEDFERIFLTSFKEDTAPLFCRMLKKEILKNNNLDSFVLRRASVQNDVLMDKDNSSNMIDWQVFTTQVKGIAEQDKILKQISGNKLNSILFDYLSNKKYNTESFSKKNLTYQDIVDAPSAVYTEEEVNSLLA